MVTWKQQLVEMEMNLWAFESSIEIGEEYLFNIESHLKVTPSLSELLLTGTSFTRRYFHK